jgi:hypothetical protein
MCLALDAAPEAGVAGAWQNFFACYDEFLEAARDAQSRLAVQDPTPLSGEDPHAGSPRGSER